jgi:hypothetical protein
MLSTLDSKKFSREIIAVCAISGFCHDLNETFAVLGYYAAKIVS